MIMRSFAPPVTDRKIKFAVVGCGRIAQSHFNAIKQHANRAELVDVCDIDPGAVAKAAELTGARSNRCLSDMLKATDADIVVLTTPSGLHAEQAAEIAAS